MKVQVSKTGKYERPSDPKKVLALAVTEAGAEQSPEGWRQMVRLLQIDHLDSVEDPKTKLKSYSAKGKVSVQMLRLTDDVLFPKMEHKFTIEAQESFDDIGLPDITVNSLTIQK